MTTIAWDGRTLAGDTLVVTACMRTPCERKVFRLVTDPGPVVLLGVSGDEGVAMRLVQWVQRGALEADTPKFEKDSVTAIMIMKDGAFRIDSTCHPLKLMTPFHAVGMGRDYAMAAMHLGKSAREAVELAAVYDIYTGGDIIEVSFDG